MDSTVFICICLHIIFTPSVLSQCNCDQEHKLDHKVNLESYEDVNNTKAVCLCCYRRFDNSFLRFYQNNGTVCKVYANNVTIPTPPSSRHQCGRNGDVYYLMIKEPRVEDAGEWRCTRLYKAPFYSTALKYDEHNGTLIEENSTPKTLLTLADHPDNTGIVQQTTETSSAIFNYIIRYKQSEPLLLPEVSIACLTILLSLLFLAIIVGLFIKANCINIKWLEGKKYDSLSDEQSIPQPYEEMLSPPDSRVTSQDTNFYESVSNLYISPVAGIRDSQTQTHTEESPIQNTFSAFTAVDAGVRGSRRSSSLKGLEIDTILNIHVISKYRDSLSKQGPVKIFTMDI